jgi:outer membrane protein OmpA-like peptidoglycan-associated protein
MKKQIYCFCWKKSIILFLTFFISLTIKAQLISLVKVDSISIIFDFGSFKIENQSQLIEKLNKIDFGQTGKVVLKAYTDSVGSVQYNKKLASKRLFETAQLIKNSKLKSLVLDSMNLNENQNTASVNEEEKRRVDIIVYSTSSNFKLKIPIVLNIAFQGNKADLVGEDKNEDLTELLRIMKSDPSITIKLNGHVAVRPDQELSLNRALRIKKYVIKAGISEKRITCEGFSNTKPLIPNGISEEEHSKNRRVEVIFYK